MPRKQWKLYLTGGLFIALLAGIPLVVGNVGCGGEEGCTLAFADSSTQEICDNQAAAAGCDIPATWSGLTQICEGNHCQIGCPSSGNSH